LIQLWPSSSGLGVLLFVITLILPASARAEPGAAAAAVVAQQLPLLNEILQQGTIDSAAVGALIDQLVDLRSLTTRTFGSYTRRSLQEYEKPLSDSEFRRLIARNEARLVSLFRSRVVTDLMTLMRSTGLSRFELGDPFAKMESSREASLKLRGHTAGDETIVVELILERERKHWKVVDLTYDHLAFSQRYEDEFSDVLKNDYSLAVLAARLAREDFISLEDFASSQEGTLPAEWYWRDRDKDNPKLFEVHKGANYQYLAAQDTGLSVILLKIAHWNPQEFPILTWCWRANALPPGGDERITETNDSAAGLYVIFHENWFGLPIQIKYVWSTTLPVGTIGRRDMIARPYFFVEQSGDESLGQWEFEQVDIVADYDRVFDEIPKNRTLGIGVLTDSNNTHTYAEADYADFRVWPRQALESGSMPDHCACLPDATDPGMQHGQN
jgi:hypothetical protein